MNTDTSEKIVALIRTNGQVRPNDLVKLLKISNVAVHKQLKNLLTQGKIRKIGQPPLVYYQLAAAKPQLTIITADGELKNYIDQHFLYLTPTGELLYGLEGFTRWVIPQKTTQSVTELAGEYVKTHQSAQAFRTPEGWIDATDKIKSTFHVQSLDKVLYQDFYALPKFGKTKFGQLVLHAKQAQDKKLIAQVAREIKPTLEKVITSFEIDAIGFIPHSLPRNVPFLKELESHLQLTLPQINLVKIKVGDVPVAQKTLSKLEERIENARDTIFVKDLQVPYQKILLIDDAVGSGATLLETAKKLKESKHVESVIGYAIVGSMKGFEVIREV